MDGNVISLKEVLLGVKGKLGWNSSLVYNQLK